MFPIILWWIKLVYKVLYSKDIGTSVLQQAELIARGLVCFEHLVWTTMGIVDDYVS